MSGGLDALRTRLAEIEDLRRVAGLLLWDQQTQMPPRGAEARAEQVATLERLAHERFVDAETGRLLEAARAVEARESPESDAASLVRVARRDWEKARRVPAALAADLARTAALGQSVWAEALARSDFGHFLPFLERTLALKHRYVACFPEVGDPYDVLLDDFEPGMRAAEVAELFTALRDGLVPLVATIAAHPAQPEGAASLHGDFPEDEQRRLLEAVLPRLGYDPEGWRLDRAVHPFAFPASQRDVRLTTRFDRSYLGTALYSAMHECGHGLYGAGIDPALARSPLDDGASLGVHESQSRLYENLVGRSRPFCSFLLPLLRERFGAAFAGVDEEALYRGVNLARPSLLRVEADEATYSLHVILRFELERDLVAERLTPADVPEAWSAGMRELLGVEVPDDAHGALQDVHWSEGMLGYFPTYALGNIMSAQIWERLRSDLPDLDGQMAAGELTALREWLREHVHRHGRKFGPRETLARAVGGPIDVAPYLRYLRAKYGELYAHAAA